MLAVPGEVGDVGRRKVSEFEAGVDAQAGAVEGAEGVGDEDLAGLGEGDQAAVEGGVEVGGQEQTVVDVEALGVAGQAPGLDVAGAEELPDCNLGDGAAVSPVEVEGFAKDVLADALDDEVFGFGGAGQAAGGLLELAQGFGGQGADEVVDFADEALEGGGVRHDEVGGGSHAWVARSLLGHVGGQMFVGVVSMT